MLNRDEFRNFNFIKKEPLTGSLHGMRYLLKKQSKEEDTVLYTCVWPEPFAYDFTAQDMKTEKEFEFSEEGLRDAVDWINEMREEKKDIYDNIPALTEFVKKDNVYVLKKNL